MKPIVKVTLFAAVGLVALKVLGVRPSDVYNLAMTGLNSAASDSKALVSGEYSKRIANQMKQEAQRQQNESSAPASEGDLSDELKRELAAERQRLLQAKAEALEQHGTIALQSDIEGLKRQVREQSQKAGEIQ